MKKLILIAALCICGAATAAKPVAHRVVSCNIRVALDADEQKGVGWSVRKKICVEVMKHQRVDIFCLQEVFAPQNEDIRKAFPGYIALGYDGPEMDAATGTAYFGIAKNMVLFSKKRYELLAAGTYWLSETPLIGGSMSWETARARHFNWVRLRDRRTGKEFRVASIHLDHISQQARTAQIEAFIAEAAQYPAGFPQILAGDFNSKPGNPVMEALEKAGWHDAWPEANGADAVREPSFHGFKGEMYKAKGKPGPIDFIFLKGAGIKAVESHLVKDSVKGILPSDHYFLSADIVIE